MKNISTFKYVYDSDENGNQQLLGVEIASFNNICIRNAEYYVGFELDINDVVNNKVNADILGIDDLEKFKRYYYSARATGIVFFPQTGKYSYLERGDTVIHWDGNDKIESQLEEKIIPYKNQLVSPQEFLETIHESLMDNQAVLELSGVPTRSLARRVSER